MKTLTSFLLLVCAADFVQSFHGVGMRRFSPAAASKAVHSSTYTKPTLSSPVLKATLDNYDIEEIRQDLMPSDVDINSMGIIAASQGLLGAGAYALCSIFDINPFAGPTPFVIDVNSIIVALQFTLPMIVVGLLMEKFATEPLKQITRDAKIFSVRMLGHDTNPLVALMYAAGISTVAALTEELAFRGFLFHYLNMDFGFAPAFLLSSAAFGLIHYPMFGSSAALEMIQGAIFAYAYWLSDYNLAVPVFIHGLFDFFTLMTNWGMTNLQMKSSLKKAEQRLLNSISLSQPIDAQFDVISHAVFDMFDTDTDGYIEFDEFISGLRLMGVWFGAGKMGSLPFNLSAMEVSEMFSELDTDRDGKISYEEYSVLFMGMKANWMTMI